MQFENIWQKDLLDLAENGFARRFANAKFRPTKYGDRLKVAIIGSGPAGEKCWASCGGHRVSGVGIPGQIVRITGLVDEECRASKCSSPEEINFYLVLQ